MGIEHGLIRLRWFALGSLLLIVSIMQPASLRVLLFLISAGVLYNLALTMVSTGRFDIERLKGLNTLTDGAGLLAVVALTGGLNSLFFIYLAVFVFSVSIRYTVQTGLFAAFLVTGGLSPFYFSDPTSSNLVLLGSRAVIFLLAAAAALFLRVREEAVAPPIRAREEEKEEAAEVEPEAEEEVAPAPELEAVEAVVAEDIPAKVLKEMPTVTMPERKEEPPDIKQKLTELAVLHEASKVLGASLILEDVLSTAVDIANKGLMTDVGGALIFDEGMGLLKVGGLRGFTAEEREIIESTTFTPGEGIFGECYSTSKTMLVDDIAEDEAWSLPFDGRIKSFLATPLATDGYKMGVLFVGKFIKEPFQQDARDFVETIAGQAAIAIENAKLYARAQELAIHDGLTGLYNYRYFMKQLGEEIKRAARYHRSVSLLMLDIDLFKKVNDTFGHRIGDEVLRGLGQTLQLNTRETDTVARYGGEEFAVILPEAMIENAMEVASKLRQAVAEAEYAKRKNQVVKITVSLGVATYPSCASNQEELLRLADDALYAAKAQRNSIFSAEDIRAQ